MQKYLQVIKTSISYEFAYRSNIIMWRVSNILQVVLLFSLWDVIFSDPSRLLFGYSKEMILAYVFGLIIVKAFVLSASTREVAGEIARGDLSNFLIKPLNYFKYWIARDVSSKVINISFAVIEAVLLFIILRPPFFIQSNPLYLAGFLLMIFFAMAIFFLLNFLVSLVPFWVPEAAWGIHFLVTVVIVEFLSGALFPLDIMPQALQNILDFTPFPYLVYYPLQIYLGKVEGVLLLKGLAISAFWIVGLWMILKSTWKKGLKAYEGQGR